MKTKIFVLAALLMASLTNLRADETCTRIYGDEDYSANTAISYAPDGTLFLNASNFSSAVVGNAIKIYGFNTGGGAHKLYLGEYDKPLPGSDFRNPSNINDDRVLFYITEDMLSAIKSEHLRVYGEGISVNRVEICDGKAGALKFGKTIWTGYFWMDDSWSLEIYKEAFASIDFSKYGKMRIYYEANRTDFLMRLFTKFGAEGEDDYDDGTSIKLAGSELDNHMEVHAGGVTPERIYLTPTYVDIPLTETIKTYLSTKDEDHGSSLFIKCNKESGAAFNVTDVVLLPISPEDCSNCFYVY
ncbi:MAG: hypothetical protein IKG86_04780 [Paludibacteraceae bacterium]|nr:hypothetical protein [Paludibacteraceae bacterium]